MLLALSLERRHCLIEGESSDDLGEKTGGGFRDIEKEDPLLLELSKISLVSASFSSLKIAITKTVIINLN